MFQVASFTGAPFGRSGGSVRRPARAPRPHRTGAPARRRRSPALGTGVRLARRLAPAGGGEPAGSEVGEAAVAVEGAVDLGQVDAAGERHELREHLGAADDERLPRPVGRGRACGGRRGAHGGLGGGAVGGDDDARRRGEAGTGARQHDVEPAGQGAADRLEGAPSHDDRMAHRHALEPGQVLGQPPRQPRAAPVDDADHAVAVGGGDQRPLDGRRRARFVRAHEGRLIPPPAP